MPHTALPTFEVPVVDEMSLNEGRTFDGVQWTDFLLNKLLRHGAGMLHSNFRCDEGRWRIVSGSAESHGPDEVVAISQNKSCFRSVLGHLGARFLNGQVYGGFAEGFFIHRGTSRYFALYTANDQLRGYWLRLYVRPA